MLGCICSLGVGFSLGKSDLEKQHSKEPGVVLPTVTCSAGMRQEPGGPETKSLCPLCCLYSAKISTPKNLLSHFFFLFTAKSFV